VLIAELRAAAQQFAQHKRRPALGEDLGALGDRAKLTVASHRRPLPCSDDAVMIAAGGPPTSTNSGLDDGPAALFIAFGYRDACIFTRGPVDLFHAHSTDLGLDSRIAEAHECRARSQYHGGNPQTQAFD